LTEFAVKRVVKSKKKKKKEKENNALGKLFN